MKNKNLEAGMRKQDSVYNKYLKKEFQAGRMDKNTFNKYYNSTVNYSNKRLLPEPDINFCDIKASRQGKAHFTLKGLFLQV